MLGNVIKFTALGAIRLYQKYLSPYKGYCCAFRFHTSKQSCSAFGYRSIKMFGLVKGVNVLRARLCQCSSVHKAYTIKSHVDLDVGRYVRYKRQAGFVDSCDCGGSDCSGCDMPSMDCNNLNPFDCSPGSSKNLDVVEAVVDEVGDLERKKTNVKNFIEKKRPLPKKNKPESGINIKKVEK